MYDFAFGDVSLTRIVEMEMPLLEARAFSFPIGMRPPSRRTRAGWCRAITDPTVGWW